MPKSEIELPTLVRKQAEKALFRLNESKMFFNELDIEYKGARILISEFRPHPNQSKLIKLPFALLDYKATGWVLLYRGTNGAWQILPSNDNSTSIEEKISAILTDIHGVFCRQ